MCPQAKHSFADLDVLRAIATTTNFRFQDVILALSRSGELTDRAGAAVRNGLSLDNVLLEMGFTMDASDVLLHLDRAQLASLFRLGPRSSRSHRVRHWETAQYLELIPRSVGDRADVQGEDGEASGADDGARRDVCRCGRPAGCNAGTTSSIACHQAEEAQRRRRRRPRQGRRDHQRVRQPSRPDPPGAPAPR